MQSLSSSPSRQTNTPLHTFFQTTMAIQKMPQDIAIQIDNASSHSPRSSSNTKRKWSLEKPSNHVNTRWQADGSSTVVVNNKNNDNNGKHQQQQQFPNKLPLHDLPNIIPRRGSQWFIKSHSRMKTRRGSFSGSICVTFFCTPNRKFLYFGSDCYSIADFFASWRTKFSIDF